MKATAAALAARSGWSTGGLGVGGGAGSVPLSGVVLLPVAGVTEVVAGLATAAGWAGLSRPTTKAVATPTTTASTPATATRRR